MRHGSLFSGIGGFDLAAHWMGWENVFQCEIDDFCQQVLKYHYPNSILYDNIQTTNFNVHRGGIDVLSGGFPCQPFSTAGKRNGETDPRFLWPEMLRAIKSIQPQWIIAENVPGLLNIGGGLVFDQICLDLENEGYKVWPFILPACGKNAPHKRSRIFIIAHTNGKGMGYNRGTNMGKKKEIWGRNEGAIFGTFGNNGTTSDTNCHGSQRGLSSKIYEIKGRLSEGHNFEKYPNYDGSIQKPRNWENFPTQSPICGGDDGIPSKLHNVTLPKWKEQTIKAYGNAIVPQLALSIFKSIINYQNQQK